MTVEYLVLIDSNEEYCKSVKTLNSLVQAYDGIIIKDKSIQYKECTFDYIVQFGDPKNIKHRFFHIKITNSKDEQYKKFQEFLKLIRTILAKISGQPVEVLNDDVSSSRCISAYPIIHNLENKMRKLITKFMFTTIGLGWTKDSTPKEVVDSIKTSKPKSTNFLYEVDFIQLSKFLFNNYASLDSKKIIEKIKDASSINDLNLEELKEFVPQSNWDRYFATLVDCSNDFLEKRWQRLYEIRNKVAHNRFITEDEFIELERVSNEVDEKLLSALENLDKIHVSDEQKEEVAENVAYNRDEMYAKFLRSWNILLEMLSRVAILVSDPDDANKLGKNSNWRNLINTITKKHVLPKKFKSELQELASFRNTLVHHTDVIFTQDSIEERIAIVIELFVELKTTYESLEEANNITKPSSER
jgi:uncharacterized protein YutE (UPF0331/DUF86 family)